VRILALDTTLTACAVAIVDDEATRAALSEPMQRGHAERLAPMVHAALTTAELRAADLDRIVVTTGPGSFTGVRVGLAFARAFALARSIPCIGISTLEALALEAGESGLRGGVIAAPIGFYVALFRDGEAVLPPTLTDRAALDAAGWTSDAVWRGPAAAELGGEPFATPNVVALARLGARRAPETHAPVPLYLREPDAKLPAA